MASKMQSLLFDFIFCNILRWVASLVKSYAEVSDTLYPCKLAAYRMWLCEGVSPPAILNRKIFMFRPDGLVSQVQRVSILASDQPPATFAHHANDTPHPSRVWYLELGSTAMSVCEKPNVDNETKSKEVKTFFILAIYR